MGVVVCIVHSNVLSIVCAVGSDASLAEACVIVGFVLLGQFLAHLYFKARRLLARESLWPGAPASLRLLVCRPQPRIARIPLCSGGSARPNDANRDRHHALFNVGL